MSDATMKYVSTRGQTEPLAFSDVLLAGLAPDGGLYLPEGWPRWDAETWASLRPLNYAELATRIIAPFADAALPEATIRALCRASYDPAYSQGALSSPFRHAAVAPLSQLRQDDWLMELYWGPTLAFKDFALQLVGRLFDAALQTRDTRMTVVGATSGDTGSAAIEACRGLERVDIFILHPHGRVSDVQRRQMTTVDEPHVHNLAVEGTFDDCQDLVKALFADESFRRDVQLGAVNSINWARVLAQVVYYAWAALRLGAPEREVSMCVPTGNFGNVFAGWVATQMGLPIRHLYVGSNRNDILTRFFQNNDMRINGVHPSLSPSMDIQISSNFERLLFELSGRDGAWTAARMKRFRAFGELDIPEGLWGRAREQFDSTSVDDQATVDTIRQTYQDTGRLIDPHTAVGVCAAQRLRRPDDGPIVTLATAHPAKFPDAVRQATGITPELPPHLANLFDRKERFEVIANDAEHLMQIVRARTRAGGRDLHSTSK